PAPLRPLAGGAQEVEVEAKDVAGLIETLESHHKGFKDRLCDASGNLRSYVRIFVNDEDVRFLQEKGTPLKSGDTVSIVPAIADCPGEGTRDRGASKLSRDVAPAVRGGALRIDHREPRFTGRLTILFADQPMESRFDLLSDGHEVVATDGPGQRVASSLRWE